jgi:hypothetical protein
MNHILYNISLLILVVGIILMTVYITKASNNGFQTSDKLNLNKNYLIEKPYKTIYDYKVNKEYEKMFSQPSIWMGYQDFDPKEQSQKIYVK